jgi:HK97 family phage portal protein
MGKSKRDRTPAWNKREQRAITGDFFAPFQTSVNPTPVNHRTVENLVTVVACVAAIAGNIASLPVCVYRLEGRRKVEVPNHPLMTLVRRGPNRWQTWRDWMEWTIASTLLRGNGLNEVVRDNTGAVSSFLPLVWDGAAVSILQSGRLVYQVTDAGAALGGSGRSRRLLDSEVMHIRDRTDDGLVGRTRISRAYGAVQTALQVQDFTRSMWKNGIHPSGMITSDKDITPETKKALRDDVNELYSGTQNAARAMVLDQGLKWTSLGVSPHDAELIASRRFSTEEICRLFDVPSVVVSDLTNSSFNNAEVMLRAFATLALKGWAAKVEQEIARSALLEDECVEIDLSDLTRGDPAARWAANRTAVDAGILSVNEIREREGYDPTPGGEVPARVTAGNPSSAPSPAGA